MPSSWNTLRALGGALALAACSASIGPDVNVDAYRTRGEIDAADASIAVRDMLAASTPVCMAWPSLWIEENDRRDNYPVRYDLMRRDWGESVSGASERRMEEFVAMGFLTKRAEDDGAATYALTEVGRRYLRQTDESVAGARFCAPSQRRLVSITNVTPGDYRCGSALVRFTHIADTPPDWARTENARARWQTAVAPVGQVSHGTVTLSRRGDELRSTCEPADLQLNAPAN